MDQFLSEEELHRLRTRNDTAEIREWERSSRARYRNYNYGYESFEPYYEGESYADSLRDSHRPIGCDFPLTPGSQNHCYCWPNGRRDGCHRCRPNLWAECPCGADYHPWGECYCWSTCQECETRGPLESRPYVDSCDVYFCDAECAEAGGYTECEYSSWDGSCGTFTANGNGLCDSHQACDCGDCEECLPRGLIHSYSYKPSPRFLGTGPVYLGLECEINTGYLTHSTRSIAQVVNDAVGRYAYLKSDGSIGEGFELVTHPMSHDWAMGEFPWQLFSTLTDDYGVENDERCGIHVHVSRDGFRDAAHMYRWQKFFYRNRRPIQTLARRRNSSWAKFTDAGRDLALYAAKSGTTGNSYHPGGEWYVPRRYRGTYLQWDRYSAINVQNEATLEVRIFAGSVNATEVKAALNLVHGSVEYTRNLDSQKIIKSGGWEFPAFADWVSGRTEYAPLHSEIERLVNA